MNARPCRSRVNAGVARIAVIAGLVCASFCPDARAQAVHSKSAAEEAFRLGREAVKREDYEGAYTQFVRSYGLDATPGTMLNLAECETHLGKLVEALDHFTAAGQGMTSGDDRLTLIAERVKTLNARIPSVVVRSISGASQEQVTLDGTTVFWRVKVDTPCASSSSPCMPTFTDHGRPFDTPLRINAGSHTARWLLFVGAWIDITHSFDLAEGETKDLLPPPEVHEAQEAYEAKMKAAADRTHASAPLLTSQGGAPQVQQQTEPTTWTDPTQSARTGAAIGMGLGFGAPGAIGLILGSVWGANVLSDKSIVSQHCRGNVCDQTGVDAASDGQTKSVGSPIALAAGAAFGAVAIYSVYAFLKSPSFPTTAIALRPVPGGGGIALTQGF